MNEERKTSEEIILSAIERLMQSPKNKKKTPESFSSKKVLAELTEEEVKTLLHNNGGWGIPALVRKTPSDIVSICRFDSTIGCDCCDSPDCITINIPIRRDPKRPLALTP